MCPARARYQKLTAAALARVQLFANKVLLACWELHDGADASYACQSQEDQRQQMRVLEQAKLLFQTCKRNFRAMSREDVFSPTQAQSTRANTTVDACKELDSKHPANSTGGVLASVAEQPFLGK